jgi:hypothetical protein
LLRTNLVRLILLVHKHFLVIVEVASQILIISLALARRSGLSHVVEELPSTSGALISLLHLFANYGRYCIVESTIIFLLFNWIYRALGKAVGLRWGLNMLLLNGTCVGVLSHKTLGLVKNSSHYIANVFFLLT